MIQSFTLRRSTCRFVRTVLLISGSLLIATSLLASTRSSGSEGFRLKHSSTARVSGNPNTFRQLQEVATAKWREILGAFPVTKCDLKPRIVAMETTEHFTRLHVSYDVDHGVATEAYLLVPNLSQRRLPAVVVFHPTTPFHARGVAGLEPEYPREKWIGVHLARSGFIALCPKNFINSQGTNWGASAVLELKRKPDWTGMARMTWDAIRAVDYLETLPRVDKHRIGCIGHSLGAKVALYSMAFERRYRAGVFSEGGLGLQMSNWGAPWYLGARMPTSGSGHEELLLLIAPRPFLVLGGGSADTDASEKLLLSVRTTLRSYQQEDGFSWINHGQGHAFPAQASRASLEFLSRNLQ